LHWMLNQSNDVNLNKKVHYVIVFGNYVLRPISNFVLWLWLHWILVYWWQK
jgi:hypothetical protein